MATTAQELDSFTQFAKARLEAGTPEPSLDELFDLWRLAEISVLWDPGAEVPAAAEKHGLAERWGQEDAEMAFHFPANVERRAPAS